MYNNNNNKISNLHQPILPSLGKIWNCLRSASDGQNKNYLMRTWRLSVKSYWILRRIISLSVDAMRNYLCVLRMLQKHGDARVCAVQSPWTCHPARTAARFDTLEGKCDFILGSLPRLHINIYSSLLLIPSLYLTDRHTYVLKRRKTFPNTITTKIPFCFCFSPDVVECNFKTYVPLNKNNQNKFNGQDTKLCKMTFNDLVTQTEFGHTAEETEDNQQYCQDVVSTWSKTRHKQL